MAQLFHLPKAVRVDSSGSPYAGAKANFYLTGTTTPTNTYQNSALSTPHANPVVADANGQFAAIYLDPDTTYRVIITDSNDVTLDDVDPITTAPAAADVSVADSGGYFADTDVEAVLQDIGANYTKNASTETITGDRTYSGANLNMADNLITRPEIKDYGITHTALTQSGATRDVDLTSGNSFAFTLTQNCTITLSNPPASGTYGRVRIRITQDGGGGAYTVTWPSGVDWSGGAPTMSTGNNAVDIFYLETDDGGTTWYGSYLQAFA